MGCYFHDSLPLRGLCIGGGWHLVRNDFGLVSIEHCMHVVGGLQVFMLCVICEL